MKLLLVSCVTIEQFSVDLDYEGLFSFDFILSLLDFHYTVLLIKFEFLCILNHSFLSIMVAHFTMRTKDRSV